MKITDVSSSSGGEAGATQPSKNEEENQEDCNVNKTRKQTLLEKFHIPIEQLDFDYVNKCNDPIKVERILRILRSGEEGTYPDLEGCVEGRLEELKPSSRLLRKEIPALTSKQLDTAQRKNIEDGILEWISEVGAAKPEGDKDKTIFDSSGGDLHSMCTLPVRGSSGQSTKLKQKRPEKPGKSENSKEKEKIKSWEYDKWDKYDVDAELTKLDIKDMQQEEWERREKPKVIEEEKKIKKLMKNTKAKCSKSTKKPSPTRKDQDLGRSYVEELDDDDDDEEGIHVTTPAAFVQNGRTAKSLRKTKIVLDDLNLRI